MLLYFGGTHNVAVNVEKTMSLWGTPNVAVNLDMSMKVGGTPEVGHI